MHRNGIISTLKELKDELDISVVTKDYLKSFNKRTSEDINFIFFKFKLYREWSTQPS